MKKLVNPIDAGGAPLFATETFSELLSAEIWDAMESLFNNLEASRYDSGSSSGTVSGFILTGIDITPQGGDLYDVSAGIVFFPEIGIARYAGTTGVSTTSFISINPGTPVIEQKTFFDTVDKDYSTTVPAELSTSAGLTGGVVIRVSSNEVIWRPTIDNILSSISGDTLKRMYTITDWDMDTDAQYVITIPDGDVLERKQKLFKVTCWVKQDGLTSQQFVNLERPTIGGVDFGFIEVIANDGAGLSGFVINLSRVAGGFFDDSTFSANGTRGQVLIEYMII